MKREYKELLFTKAFKAYKDAYAATTIHDKQIAYAREKAYEDVIDMLGLEAEYARYMYNCYS